MSEQHTPGWAQYRPQVQIISESGTVMCDFIIKHPGTDLWKTIACNMPAYDARRMATAWNAVNGISTEGIEVILACGGVTALQEAIKLSLETTDQMLAERDKRIAALECRLKSDGEIMHDLLVGNQAAWIEWQRGAGAEAAMTWVQGSLMGVGVPDENTPWATEAQAWYSANKADPFPTCFCGRPSNTLWMGQGFCSDAHYEQGRAKADADAAGKTGLPLFDGTSPDTEGGSCD